MNKTYVEGKKDKTEWMMKFGEYEFPIKESFFLSDDSALNEINFAHSEMMFCACLKNVEEVVKFIKSKNVKIIDFTINDGYSIVGELTNYSAIGNKLYIIVRFIQNE